MVEKNKIMHDRRRMILDSVLFILILFVLSISLIFISGLDKEPNAYYEKYQTTDENIEQSMNSILSSTVPRAVYTDKSGTQHEYVGNSVEDLLISELVIIASNNDYNRSNLEFVLESEINELLKSSFSQSQDYLLLAKFATDNSNTGSGTEPEVIISNLDDELELKLDVKPIFIKEINTAASDRSDLPGNEIIIELYLK
jgi:hypothetical protein